MLFEDIHWFILTQQEGHDLQYHRETEAYEARKVRTLQGERRTEERAYNIERSGAYYSSIT